MTEIFARAIRVFKHLSKVEYKVTYNTPIASLTAMCKALGLDAERSDTSSSDTSDSSFVVSPNYSSFLEKSEETIAIQDCSTSEESDDEDSSVDDVIDDEEQESDYEYYSDEDLSSTSSTKSPNDSNKRTRSGTSYSISKQIVESELKYSCGKKQKRVIDDEECDEDDNEEDDEECDEEDDNEEDDEDDEDKDDEECEDGEVCEEENAISLVNPIPLSQQTVCKDIVTPSTINSSKSKQTTINPSLNISQPISLQTHKLAKPRTVLPRAPSAYNYTKAVSTSPVNVFEEESVTPESWRQNIKIVTDKVHREYILNSLVNSLKAKKLLSGVKFSFGFHTAKNLIVEVTIDNSQYILSIFSIANIFLSSLRKTETIPKIYKFRFSSCTLYFENYNEPLILLKYPNKKVVCREKVECSNDIKWKNTTIDYSLVFKSDRNVLAATFEYPVHYQHFVAWLIHLYDNGHSFTTLTDNNAVFSFSSEKESRIPALTLLTDYYMFKSMYSPLASNDPTTKIFLWFFDMNETTPYHEIVKIESKEFLHTHWLELYDRDIAILSSAN